MLRANKAQSVDRLLYFDEQPSSCMRAIEAADDIRLPIETVCHPGSLSDACRAFKPTAVLAVLRPGDMQARRVISVISVAGPQLPVLVAGDRDISLDAVIGSEVVSRGLDVRGSVCLGKNLRDLQLALLYAISRLRGGPIN